MAWLDDIVAQHSELESPLSFWMWSGLASISAVVKDQVWLNRQIYNLYPNVYIMLHAESGLRKDHRLAWLSNWCALLTIRASYRAVVRYRVS